MNTPRWLVLVAVVAVVSLLGGLGGGSLAQALAPEEYEYGIALLEGSTNHPNATGLAFFEAKKTESILKVQLSGTPELANTTLDVIIVTAEVGGVETDVKVGVITLDSKGRGKYEIKAKASSGLLPAVDNGMEIQLKQTGVSGNKLVASGTF